MGIILTGMDCIFVVPDYFDWCVFECLFLCWLEFPSKFIQCIPGAAGKVEQENESERGRIKFTRTFKCSRQRELQMSVILGRKLIFSQTYFFSESDPTIVASSEGLIIQQSHCAMTHFPPPNLGIKKESEILPLPVWLGGVIYCHRIRLSHHNIVILCWWSLAQRNINTLIACLQ